MPGANWDDEIKRKPEEADRYLFLVSADLLNSDDVQNVELPIARRRHDTNKARLAPVVVRKCSWDSDAYFKAFQALPKGGRSVKEWQDKDQAFHDVEMGLRKIIARMRKTLDRS